MVRSGNQGKSRNLSMALFPVVVVVVDVGVSPAIRTGWALRGWAGREFWSNYLYSGPIPESQECHQLTTISCRHDAQ